MKRFAAMLAVSVLMVLWIASGDRMSAGQRTDGLYYEVTGIHPDAVLMRINGEDISAEEYLYWLAYDCEYLTSYVPNLDFSAEVSNGMTYGSYAKADAVETVAAAAPQMRLRLGSIEPTVITEDFCRRAAATGQVCRHFHLSLQSGCDRTLARMNRKYNTAEFLACVERLRRYFPGCALTADMITGFPGETEADQAAAVAFLEQVGFAAVHVFPYSRRPGTKADAMPEQLSHAVKSARAHEAQRVADACKQRYLVQQVGQTLPVLFETEHDGSWVGHSDNYCLVRAAGDDLRGLVKNVKISAVSGQMLVGDLV